MVFLAIFGDFQRISRGTRGGERERHLFGHLLILRVSYIRVVRKTRKREGSRGEQN